jgi:hypothetical protein
VGNAVRKEAKASSVVGAEKRQKEHTLVGLGNYFFGFAVLYLVSRVLTTTANLQFLADNELARMKGFLWEILRHLFLAFALGTM